MRKQFPKSKINTALKELEGFTFIIFLDLTRDTTSLIWIQTHPKSVSYFFNRKYSNLGLAMDIAGSPESFQSKISELMAALK